MPTPEIHNPLVSSTVLSIITGVDLKTSAATTVYTVPAGRSCFVTGLFVDVTAATLVTVVPIASLGQNSTSYNDIIPATTFTNLTSAGSAYYVLPTNPFIVVSASTAIKFNVSTGATATTDTASIILLGFLI